MTIPYGHRRDALGAGVEGVGRDVLRTVRSTSGKKAVRSAIQMQHSMSHIVVGARAKRWSAQAELEFRWQDGEEYLVLELLDHDVVQFQRPLKLREPCADIAGPEWR